MFPAIRLRRTRQSDWSRRLVSERALGVNDLVWSIVVSDRADPVEPVAAMPGVERLSLAALAKAAKEAQSLGIPAIALFPHIDPSKRMTKDPRRSILMVSSPKRSRQSKMRPLMWA